MNIIGLYNYWIVVILMLIGFYIVIADENLIKKLVGLGIFQTSVFFLYISMGKVAGGTAPIETVPGAVYSNPLQLWLASQQPLLALPLLSESMKPMGQ